MEASPNATGALIRNRRRVWIATLLVAVLITGGGLVLIYNDDAAYQGADRALTSQNESLTGQILALQGNLVATHTSLVDANAQLATLSAELQHPSLGIWNVPQQLQGPTYYLAAGVPDTFTYHLRLTSTGPMDVSILSYKQFGLAILCVDNGVGNTDWCMHHQVSAIGRALVTTVNIDFHEAEGCAAYITVITALGHITVTPNVSVTYNPASHPTGACA